MSVIMIKQISALHIKQFHVWRATRMKRPCRLGRFHLWDEILSDGLLILLRVTHCVLREKTIISTFIMFEWLLIPTLHSSPRFAGSANYFYKSLLMTHASCSYSVGRTSLRVLCRYFLNDFHDENDLLTESPGKIIYPF